MKKIITAITMFVVGGSAIAENAVHEASMNFDLKNVVPFLVDLENKYQLGINVKELGEFTEAVPVENEKSIVVDIRVSGKKSKMEYRVFMDDIEAPDLYMFFTSPELARSVGDFMSEWAEARGK